MHKCSSPSNLCIFLILVAKFVLELQTDIVLAGLFAEEGKFPECSLSERLDVLECIGNAGMDNTEFKRSEMGVIELDRGTTILVLNVVTNSSIDKCFNSSKDL